MSMDPRNSRRDLLRLFSVGALMAPVIGAKPNLEATARLTEEPRVELAMPVASARPFVGNGDHEIFVMIDGQCFTARTFFLNLKRESAELSMTSCRYPAGTAPGVPGTKWTLTGECAPDEMGRLCEIYNL